MSQLNEALKGLQTAPSGASGSGENASSSCMGPAVDPLFNDPEADITFCSADGSHFQLRRKFLEANTGAFPGSEFDTRGEVVHLTESDEVLRVLFGFVHPRRHPDVEELSFMLLAGVAEAAEKYEVFSAINVCKMQMRQFVSTKPFEVLSHATKHDHPALIKEVAPYLVRLPMIKVVQRLPTRYVVPWLEYRSAWESMFEDAAKAVLNSGASNRNRRGTSYFSTSLEPEACYACKVHMLTTIQELKELISVSELKEALGKPSVCDDMKAKIDALAIFKIQSPATAS